MNSADWVKITEVCPRDGFQNRSFIPTEKKIMMIREMILAGADEIEVTSFVNPKWVPQFQDASEVYNGVKALAEEKGTKLITLVPNKKGADRAKEAGAGIVNLVLSASETHNMKNVNKTIEESLRELKSTVEEIEGLEVRLAIACVFGCPFGEVIPIERIVKICDEAYNYGIKYIGLADSAGMSTPSHTKAILKEIKNHFSIDTMGLHLHDTRGMGIANAYVALEEGFRNFDASLGALGGCPFIPGAKGNIASEDFVNMVNAMGMKTQYNLEKMLEAARKMENELEIKLGSSMMSMSTNC